MTYSREFRAAKIQDSIRQVLYRDWDPIGLPLLPADEYDDYIAPVYQILVGSRSEQELIDGGVELIGFEKSPEELRPIARRLLELDIGL